MGRVRLTLENNWPTKSFYFSGIYLLHSETQFKPVKVWDPYKLSETLLYFRQICSLNHTSELLALACPYSSFAYISGPFIFLCSDLSNGEYRCSSGIGYLPPPWLSSLSLSHSYQSQSLRDLSMVWRSVLLEIILQHLSFQLTNKIIIEIWVWELSYFYIFESLGDLYTQELSFWHS